MRRDVAHATALFWLVCCANSANFTSTPCARCSPERKAFMSVGTGNIPLAMTAVEGEGVAPFRAAGDDEPAQAPTLQRTPANIQRAKRLIKHPFLSGTGLENWDRSCGPSRPIDDE